MTSKGLKRTCTFLARWAILANWEHQIRVEAILTLELKLDDKVKECNEAIYNSERIIAIEEPQSAPMIND
jgi:hypothetical protein